MNAQDITREACALEAGDKGLLATLVAVYRRFMTPLGLGRSMFVWSHALVWLPASDRAKIVANRRKSHDQSAITTSL